MMLLLKIPQNKRGLKHHPLHIFFAIDLEYLKTEED